MAKPFVVTLLCVCPCHDIAAAGRSPQGHEFHEAACCCQHKFVVPVDCPQCQEIAADPSPRLAEAGA